MQTSSFRSSAILAAALLALSATAHAQSNVTIYGAIGVDMVSANHVYNGSTSHTEHAIEDNAIVNSRFGLKGTEDLEGGFKAVFGLESSIHPDTGTTNSGAFWNRGAFVGVESTRYGALKLGHQWNVADDYMGNYFVFGYYAPFLMSGFYALSDYYDNGIKYTSPNIGGVQLGLYYALGEGSTGRKLQGALNYGAGPLKAGVVAFSEKNTTPGLDDNTMYAGGVAYDFGVVNARLGWATANVHAATSFKANLLDVGVDAPVTSRLTLSLDYVNKDVKSSPDDTYFVRARGNYALSKRTSLNANVIYTKNKGNANFAFITQGQGFAGEAGQNQTIFTVGMTHAF